MEEKVLYISDNMRCWDSAKPGFWKFGTYLGRIVVTDQRFLFLSSGGSKMGSLFAANLLAGPLLGPLMVGKSLTKDLELEALKNEGSFVFTYAEIQHIQAVRRWDLAAYLSINTYSFMQDPFGLNMTPMRTIAETVDIQMVKKKQNNEY